MEFFYQMKIKIIKVKMMMMLRRKSLQKNSESKQFRRWIR